MIESQVRKNLWDHQVQSSPQPHHACWTMFWSATSTRFLHPSRDGDSTAALGSLVQRLTTLSGKKFLLISILNLPWRSLRPLPLVLSLVTWEKRPTPPHYTLLSGSWREREGLPSASSSPDWTDPAPSASPHNSNEGKNLHHLP